MSRGLQRPGFQMELWVLGAIRDIKVRRENGETQACLVLQDFQGGQDLWVLKVSPSLDLQVLLVLLVNLEPLVLDDLDLEAPPALLVLQDFRLHMGQLSSSPAPLVLLVHQVHQDIPTQWPPTRLSAL